MGIFNKKANIYDIELDKQDEVILAYCNGNTPIANRLEFNIYVDEKNKVVHLYDPFEQHTTSIINILNEDFVNELFDNLGKNKKKYEIYAYMKPIFNEECYLTAYNYKTNDFYGHDKDKVFSVFEERAEKEEGIIL
ncbi:TPA: hypothetical protein ACF9K4_002768 [Staphylococcus aureus]|uniref:hypothetical protein n=1 Tax=Staphylococcus aureus TaxID=1280 RepID=UPI0004455238|nr:hypothetical protein [Staphylococcus aureus]EUR16369.1 hypothetical protein T686_02740 [Staphylococcus aureus SJUD6056]MDV0205717.1 hypothetical protein [Staphylococcus aureus]CAC5966844.1 Uncharacterised protein [Staphylococcus aureus]HCZ9450667.1 hypothetical protein [Staphylococcus aureus]HDB0487059.1 hypothetical protein [Staphylococcus aureus]